jgi:hypothetical protein
MILFWCDQQKEVAGCRWQAVDSWNCVFFVGLGVGRTVPRTMRNMYFYFLIFDLLSAFRSSHDVLMIDELQVFDCE